MKHLLAFLAITLLMSSFTEKHNLTGKTFSHTYRYSTTMNEYGKGGGRCYLSLSFGEDSITLRNIRTDTSATESGGYETKSDTISTITVSYRISLDIITTDSPVLPELRVEGDTLVAPQVNIDVNGRTDLFKNARFTSKM